MPGQWRCRTIQRELIYMIMLQVKGHVVEEALTRKDMEVMKQFNLNAIRCSHYPKDPIFIN